MASIMTKMGLGILLVVTAGMHFACSSAQVQNDAVVTIERDLASNHTDVTPYENLKTRLELKAGETYLAFMQNKVNPELNKFQKAIDAVEAKYPHQYSKWQGELIAAGQGVAIRINPKNYIFNIGYRDGKNPEEDVKSGRSYGVGPTGKESDPSDIAYLTELSDYFKSEPKQIGAFFEAILLALTDCDTSGWSKLSNAGQIVATDFMAIYTAENDRHIMVDLKPNSHPWEVDLAAATFVSVAVAQTDRIMKDGQMVDGKVKDWWAKGTVGSGIGETRRDRKAFQALIAKHEMANGSEKEIRSIESVIGAVKNDDVIQGIFEYLVAPNGPKKLNGADGKKLIAAFLKYMENVQKDAGKFK